MQIDCSRNWLIFAREEHQITADIYELDEIDKQVREEDSINCILLFLASSN